MKSFHDYGAVRLLNIEAEAPADWQAGEATHMRVCLPASCENIQIMAEKGFTFGDRLLDVSLVPAKTKLDYGHLARLKPELISGRKREILNIALNSFPSDRRFHVAPAYDHEVAAAVLTGWIDELDEFWICGFHDDVAGFLALKKLDETQASIHLAAVLEKYRPAGIALSLYAGVVNEAVKMGYESIKGTISAANTPVLNLYAFLGASFSSPRDVFLKKV